MRVSVKRICCGLLVLACCASLWGCGATTQTAVTQPQVKETQPQVKETQPTQPTQPTVKTIKIPDIEKLDVTTAKTLLAGKGLIPKVEYEFNNDYEYDLIIRTEPAIGSDVVEDTPVTLYVCKGPKYYKLPHSVGYMKDVKNIDSFSWGDNGEIRTKNFSNIRVEEGYLYISMWLKCTSKYAIEFYGDFGTASINDTFDKKVPIEVIYSSKTVDNKGGKTEFDVKIPLSDLGVQKPTNIYVEFDFTVNGTRQDFEAGFNLTW